MTLPSRWRLGGALLCAVAAPAAAEPARCVVNLVGKGGYSGPCELDRGRGGSFEIAASGGGAFPGGAKRVRVAVASPRQAMVAAIAAGGMETRWGAARQAGTGCWLAMTHSVCVNDASGASLLAFTGAPARPASPAPKARVVTGLLTGLEVGDNAWLAWTDAKGVRRIGICSADACDPWISAGRLPRAMIGRAVRLSLKPGKAMSGDVVMDDADIVTAIEPSLTEDRKP